MSAQDFADRLCESRQVYDAKPVAHGVVAAIGKTNSAGDAQLFNYSDNRCVAIGPSDDGWLYIFTNHPPVEDSDE